jgi:vitamin B12 transporter
MTSRIARQSRLNSSCAGLTRASILKKKSPSSGMDCRVKPGNDDTAASPLNTAVVTLFLLPLLSSTALAQPTPIPEIVIYANQAPTEASKVGAAVTVITGEELRSKGFTTVADALRTVPGVAISQLGSRGAMTQARIRGAEANHLLVLVNDVPVNDITDGDFNFADFAIEDIDRIEVIRGPQSGIYGANAHAGVISIVTKSGRGLAKPEGSFRVEGGSRETATISSTVRGAAGPVYGAASIDYNNTNGYNVARNGNERDGSRALTVTTKAGIDLAPNFNVEGSLRYVKRHTAIDSQPFFGPLEGLAADSPADFNKFESAAARVAATWTLLDGALVQRFGASRFDQRRNDDDVVFGFFRSRGTRDNFDYKATLKGQTNVFGGEGHTLTVAADRQLEFLTIDSASLAFDPPGRAFWAKGASRSRDGLAGEYALDLPIGLTLTGALRHDWNSGFQDVTTWRTTASQRFPTGTRLHASAGTGVTNPTFIEQFGFFLGSFIGNPNLRPEHSLGWDAGVEQTWLGGRLVTDVTYFASDFEDKITLVSAGGGFISTPVNVPGISPRRGVETTAKATPVDWLTLSASYTYTDARLADGTPEIRRPRHAASGSATVRFADGRGKATVNLVYNGAMPDTWFKFPLVPVTLQAYTLVGGIVSYDMTPFATVYVRAENVFDAKYEEVFSYRAPGFAAYAGLRLRFDPVN